MNSRAKYPLRSFWFVLPVLLFASLSCDYFNTPEPDPGRLIVLLLDQSGSVKRDRTVYSRAAHTVLDSLQPGDRLVMAPITAASGEDFRSAVDGELPPAIPTRAGLLEAPQSYERKQKTFEENLRKAIAHIREGVDAFLASEARTSRTTIMESLRVVAPIFDGSPRRGVLMILSDMVEDSGRMNFEKTRFSQEFIQTQIDAQLEQGILPSLEGVVVYVAGVDSSPPERAVAIENFWRAYFKACKADLRHYGRVLFRFED